MLPTLDYQPQDPAGRKWFSARNLTLLGVSLVSLLAAAWIVWGRMTKPAIIAATSDPAVMTSGSLIETTNDTGIWSINWSSSSGPLIHLKTFAEMQDLHVACFARNGALEPHLCDFYMDGTPYLFRGDVRLVSLKGSKGPLRHASGETTGGIYASADPETLDSSEIAALETLKHEPGENLVKVSENASGLPTVSVIFMSAVRLRSDCVGCHDQAPVGTLVGAFEYTFDYYDNERLLKSLTQPSRP